MFLVAKAGRVRLAHSGTPCSSMSVAITPAWRDDDYPTGRPGLGPTAQAKVRLGNHLASVAARMLAFLASFGCLVTGKNLKIPGTGFSPVWRVPCQAVYLSKLF